MREEVKAKRQLCEDAACCVKRKSIVFNFECNTKEIQTEITFESVVTWKKLTLEYRVVLKTLLRTFNEKLSEAEVSETENEPCKDSDYVNENDDSDDGGEANTTPKPSKDAFISYWTLLLILLKKCWFPTFLSPPTIPNFVFKGFQQIVKMKCQEDHERIWKSLPNCNHYSVGNLISATSVLFSAYTY